MLCWDKKFKRRKSVKNSQLENSPSNAGARPNCHKVAQTGAAISGFNTSSRINLSVSITTVLPIGRALIILIIAVGKVSITTRLMKLTGTEH